VALAAIGIPKILKYRDTLLAKQETLDKLKVLTQPRAYPDPPCYPKECLTTFLSTGEDPRHVDQLIARTFDQFIKDSEDHVQEFQPSKDKPALSIDWRLKETSHNTYGYTIGLGKKEGPLHLVPENIATDFKDSNKVAGADQALEILSYHEMVHRHTSKAAIKFMEKAAARLMHEDAIPQHLSITAQNQFAKQMLNQIAEACTVGLENLAFPDAPPYAKEPVVWLNPSDGSSPPSVRALGAGIVAEFGAERMKNLMYTEDTKDHDKVCDYLVALMKAYSKL